MALLTFKDLCVDANDLDRMAGFWSAALGLRVARSYSDHVSLAGPTPQHGVWVNAVQERRIVKQRVHLDLHARSVAEYEELGARVLPEWGEHRWTVMADPEDGELCVFVRERPPAYRLYEIVVDSVDPVRIATWWSDLLGGRVEHGEGVSSVDRIAGAPFDAISFVTVPEPKTVKNRIHWDVLADGPEALAALTGDGAVVLRERDAGIDWTVMADPEGNEFCVFVR